MKPSHNLVPGVFCGAEIEPGTFHALPENPSAPAGDEFTEPGTVLFFGTASGTTGSAQSEIAAVVRSDDDGLAHLDGRFGCLLG